MPSLSDICGWCFAFAVACIVAVPARASEYFVAAQAAHGSGTRTDPYGLADLLDHGASPVGAGPALQALGPGDTLSFRAGTYHLSGDTASYDSALICPAASGTAAQPITIRAYPGESVTLMLDAGIQPALGSRIGISHVRFLGFTVDAGGQTAIYVYNGAGLEVGYCEAIGHYAATSDNHETIRIGGSAGAWIHHNRIHGTTGDGHNSAGIKVYQGHGIIVEDNLISDCTVGIFDKDSGVWGGGGTAASPRNLPTYRRNWLTRNGLAFLGNNQATPPSRMIICDNVIDGPIDLGCDGDGTQLFNNLIMDLAAGGAGVSGAYSGIGLAAGAHNDVNGANINLEIWNNVVLAQGATLLAFLNASVAFTATGPLAPIRVMDFDAYSGAPTFDFGDYTAQHDWFTLAQFRAHGFETHALTVAGDAAIYPDIASGGYTLAAAYRAAGRYGDPLGPRAAIGGSGGILDPDRYGPSAQGSSRPGAGGGPASSAPSGGGGRKCGLGASLALITIGLAVLGRRRAKAGSALSALRAAACDR